ncbi:MAG TPA: hypothetical protein VKP67_20595 [Xanthobacteraceae bacterium]|nr:hypothetical protein [Xanthobacteraceae bacterium]
MSQSRRAKRTRDGTRGRAGDDLDADPVIGDLIGEGRIKSRPFPGFQRLNKKVENARRIGASRNSPRHRQANLKFLTRHDPPDTHKAN